MRNDLILTAQVDDPTGRFSQFVADLAASLGAKDSAVRTRPNGRRAVIRTATGVVTPGVSEGGFGVGIESVTDDDHAHNSYADRVHIAVASALPDVRVDLLDETDQVIRSVTQHTPAA
ncbi:MULTISPECIES: hypothetical protein [Tsukamurella]|nr:MULTISPECIES: hypothetical protein [Tsukamurella]NKY17420.1 hypothetical protein [Tsukamurella spumae]